MQLMIPLSVLDLAPISEGNDAGTALHQARELAQHAERLGYRRFWMAEHHSMPGIASAAERLMAVVVLPTPPFWLAIATIMGRYLV